MKLFLTSGATPLSQRLIVQAAERGDTVHALVSTPAEVSIVEACGGIPIPGSLNDFATVRAGLDGTDILFLTAEAYPTPGVSWREMELVNVSGTRNILQVARELAIPKIIYLSHAAIYGDTAGLAVDESFRPPQPTLSHYHRTKWLAHFDVVEPAMQGGMPISIVTPGYIYGAGSGRYLDDLMARFFEKRFPFPVLFGPRTMLSVVHIDDVAQGVLLAAEKGENGANYHLGGPAVTVRELVDFWSRITGIREIVYQMPSALLRSAQPLLSALGGVAELSPLLAPEVTAILGTTGILSSDLAAEKLGWRPRSIQVGMLEIFEEMARLQTASPPRLKNPLLVRTTTARRLLAAGLLLCAVWLLWNSRTKHIGGS